MPYTVLSIPKVRFSTRELVIFATLAGMMFVSKVALQFIPNIHLLGMFIAAFTLTYRAKALLPIYVFVLLDGIYWGFSIFWAPNLYIWLPLWGAFMIIGHLLQSGKSQTQRKKNSLRQFEDPQENQLYKVRGKISFQGKFNTILVMFACALHGLSFGLLYAPFQAFIFGLSFQGTLAWIIAGLPFDIIHGMGNFFSGILILPLTSLLKKLDNSGK